LSGLAAVVSPSPAASTSSSPHPWLVGDRRRVVTDPHAPYFGTELAERSLVPDEGARKGSLGYDRWARASQ